jgi:hypothetical protein
MRTEESVNSKVDNLLAIAGCRSRSAADAKAWRWSCSGEQFSSTRLPKRPNPWVRTFVRSCRSTRGNNPGRGSRRHVDCRRRPKASLSARYRQWCGDHGSRRLWFWKVKGAMHLYMHKVVTTTRRSISIGLGCCALCASAASVRTPRRRCSWRPGPTKQWNGTAARLGLKNGAHTTAIPQSRRADGLRVRREDLGSGSCGLDAGDGPRRRIRPRSVAPSLFFHFPVLFSISFVFFFKPKFKFWILF